MRVYRLRTTFPLTLAPLPKERESIWRAARESGCAEKLRYFCFP